MSVSAPSPLTPFQQLVALGLAHLPEVKSPQVRINMLRAVAPHLPEDIRSECEIAATALELAESAQLRLRDLILS